MEVDSLGFSDNRKQAFMLWFTCIHVEYTEVDYQRLIGNPLSRVEAGERGAYAYEMLFPHFNPTSPIISSNSI